MASAKKIKKEWRYYGRPEQKENEARGVRPRDKKKKKITFKVKDADARAVGREIEPWGWTWRSKYNYDSPESRAVRDFIASIDWTKKGKDAIKALLRRHPKLIEIYKTLNHDTPL